jgi:nitrite reductase/ring-hydroxylating ferredoxin subunit
VKEKNETKKTAGTSRRKFVLGTGTAVAAGYYVATRKQWAEVGPPESVPATGVLHFSDRGRGVFLARDTEGVVYALSQRCSHQGCDVEWKPAATRFECPCHSGVYSAAGDRVSGEPIRGLVRLRTRINDDGVLEVLV